MLILGMSPGRAEEATHKQIGERTAETNEAFVINEKQKQSEEEARRPGRRLGIDYEPEITLYILQSILDFTADENHKRLPFQTRTKGLSMCKFISEKESLLGVKGVESRIKATFRQVEAKFEIGLPRAETNVRFYFENRSVISTARDMFAALLNNSKR